MISESMRSTAEAVIRIPLPLGSSSVKECCTWQFLGNLCELMSILGVVLRLFEKPHQTFVQDKRDG
jgi:hypothetical protein